MQCYHNVDVQKVEVQPEIVEDAEIVVAEEATETVAEEVQA
jgi:hypothetical protein